MREEESLRELEYRSKNNLQEKESKIKELATELEKKESELEDLKENMMVQVNRKQTEIDQA